LSADWVQAVSEAVAANTVLQQLSSIHSVGLTQVVTGTPHGDVVYHLQVGNGVAVLANGESSPEDVRFTEPYDTAVAVATGVLNAQEAFINGHIKFVGDHQKLIDAGDVFAALNPIFDKIRETTDYN
jgi:putative sterol carrier protein